MDGGAVFALVAGTMLLLFLAASAGLVVLAVRLVTTRTAGWRETAQRRGWRHADGDALSVGQRLGGSVNRTLWASLGTTTGPLTVGVVSLSPRPRGELARTFVRSPYEVPVGFVLVDLAAHEVPRLDEHRPPGMVVDHHDRLVAVRPRARLRPRGTPPSSQEAEAVLDAAVSVVQRVRPPD